MYYNGIIDIVIHFFYLVNRYQIGVKEMKTNTRGKKGAGSYIKLPNGTYELTIYDGFDEFGKRIRRKFYGKSEKQCRQARDEFIKGGKELKTTSEKQTSSLPTQYTLSS
jgi:phage anti-repressor protein